MSVQPDPITLVDLISRTSDYFKKKNINHARLSAEWLLSHVLKLDRIELYLQHDRIITKAELDHYRQLVIRRSAHEPLQYIIGEAEFMGLKFKVNTSVLIPRPETELLVEKVLVLKDILSAPVIWDIGTGSGCIAISIANFWSKSRIFGSDISSSALKIAEENLVQHHLKDTVTLLKHDFLTEKLPSYIQPDIVVSNPPYIGRQEMMDLEEEVKSYEPWTALTDEGDGLAFYERIFSLLGTELRSKFFLLELSGTQADRVINMAKMLDVEEVKVYNDLNEIPRILQIRTFQ